MGEQQTILITGATGNQGGAVMHHLLGEGFALRAMTRKPTSPKARAISELGVEIVQGDLDDEASLRAALKGVWGVFAVQNTWEAGVESEEAQGKRIARLAREAGVQNYVYTSVGSADRATGIPHFDNKWRVEEAVRALGFPSHAILRPVFFMENLPSPMFLNGDTLGAAMKADTPLQMVAVDDIGRVGARAFTHAWELAGQEIELAGDSVTMAQAAAALTIVLGRSIAFAPYPIDAVRAQSEDMALMFEWFEEVGYAADIPALDAAFGPMKRLDEWVARTL